MKTEEYKAFVGNYEQANYWFNVKGKLCLSNYRNWNNATPPKDHHFMGLAEYVLEGLGQCSMLDVGCGFGWTVHWLEWFKEELKTSAIFPVGVDISLFALSQGRRKHNIHNTVVRADVRYLPFKDNAFEGAYSFDMMEHIPEEYAEQIVSEIHRVCRERVITNVTCYVDQDVTHVNCKNPEYWRKIFSKFFRTVHVGGSRFILEK